MCLVWTHPCVPVVSIPDRRRCEWACTVAAQWNRADRTVRRGTSVGEGLRGRAFTDDHRVISSTVPTSFTPAILFSFYHAIPPLDSMSSPLPTRPASSLRRSHSTASLLAVTPSTAASRTSPRLDVCAAFFSGIPHHRVCSIASYASDACDKRFLLTASDEGELVHWVGHARDTISKRVNSRRRCTHVHPSLSRACVVRRTFPVSVMQRARCSFHRRRRRRWPCDQQRVAHGVDIVERIGCQLYPVHHSA
jgi:hypothetical protein